MEFIYSGDTLYISIEDSINFSLVNKLKSKLYRIINIYHINNIELRVCTNSDFDKTLLLDLLNDYNGKYDGLFVIK